MIDPTSFKYQKEGAAKDLVELLMQNYGWPMVKAIDVLYQSETYKKICDPKTGLYFQGPIYLFSFLKNEIETGMMQ